jgi:hypothetical protein
MYYLRYFINQSLISFSLYVETMKNDIKTDIIKGKKQNNIPFCPILFRWTILVWSCCVCRQYTPYIFQHSHIVSQLPAIIREKTAPPTLLPVVKSPTTYRRNVEGVFRNIHQDSLIYTYVHISKWIQNAFLTFISLNIV